MQFVWVYWHGGAQGDELRWSMRSVLANYVGEPRLMVVGDPPPWYRGEVIRIARVNEQYRRGYRDVLNKIHAACLSSRVDKIFVWMMDDIYFLQPVTLAHLRRHYRGGRLPARYKATSQGWVGLKADTFRVIKEQGWPLVDYCTHLPHVLEKEKWLYVWKKYGLANRVLQWELLYGAEFFRDYHPVRRIRTRVRRHGATFDNVGRIGNNSHNGWSDRLRLELMQRFPERLSVEREESAPAPSIVEAAKEVLSGRQSSYFDANALFATPVLELDRFADRYDPYVPTHDYREALALIQEHTCG